MYTNLTSNELQRRIEIIFDYAYTNSRIRIPATTCKEVGKLLHVGMFIEEIDGKYPAFEFNSETLKKLDGNDSTVCSEIAGGIRKNYSKMNKLWKIYDDNIQFEDKDIAFIVGKLNGLYISDPRRDVFGDALEIFRSKWAKQEGGQFFTDQRVTTLAMSLLEFNPKKGDDLIDICSGTGGFLLAAFNHIKKIVEDADGHENEIIKLAAKSLKGIEIDKDVADLGNSTLLARTGNYANQFIFNANSLDRKNIDKLNNIKPGSHLCAATNPPFGAKITVKNTEILNQYELAKLTNKNILEKNYVGGKLLRRAPDILFVEQNLHMLVPGKGRVAIVIPYQILSGPQTLYVRHWIIRNAHIDAVIDLPSETFQPHTGTKTALVLLRRRKSPLMDLDIAKDEQVFMSTPKWIGHDRRGKTIYEKNPDGSESDKVLTDFPAVEDAFKAFRRGKDVSKIHPYSRVIKVNDILNDDLLRINAQYHVLSESGENQTRNLTTNNKKWKNYKIGDVVEKIFFPGRFKRNYVDYYSGAVPFLGGSNITQLIISTDKWLKDDDPRLEQLAVKEGWILVTRSGTTGIVSSVPKSWDGFAMSEHVIRIVPDKKKMDPEYLLAFLKTDYCQRELAKGVFGSVIDEITPETIANIVIPVPKKEELYKDICQKVKKAEKAKQTAIEYMYGAVDELTAGLSD